MTIKAVFEKTLVRAGEVRSFQVLIGRNGWEVSERDDQKVARHYHADWHHVERTLMRFSHEIAALRNDGWRDS